MSGGERLSAIIALHRAVVDALKERGNAEEIDLANDIFRKFLTISAASHLEEETKKTVRKVVREISGQQGEILLNLIEQGILDRGYHTRFEWKRDSGANKFYSFFGKEFRGFMGEREREDEGFENFAEAARCFIALGRERNNLVHNDLAAAEFQWTELDVEIRFQRAKNFLPGFRRYLLDFAQRKETGGSPPAPP